VNNLALFVSGLVVTLLSGMGVLVYMVSLGYEQKKKKTVEVDVDLGAIEKIIVKKVEEANVDSFAGIPSVS
jgi:hypothetical protein